MLECKQILPYKLPQFKIILELFHAVWRRICQNIYPCSSSRIFSSKSLNPESLANTNQVPTQSKQLNGQHTQIIFNIKSESIFYTLNFHNSRQVAATFGLGTVLQLERLFSILNPIISKVVVISSVLGLITYIVEVCT